MNRNHTLILFSLSLFALLLVPSLVQQGMFLDGVTYAGISKNLANGIGSWWEPHYTKVLYPEFHEHPPLAFMLQSLFFSLFGDGFLTERIYCLLVALLTTWGIIAIWKMLATDKVFSDSYWVALLLWISVPMVLWSLKNNMLENTMSMFTVFAVLFILKAAIAHRFLYLSASSLLILAAFLTKGAGGLFPLATPLLYGLVFRKFKTTLPMFILLWLMFFTYSALLFGLLPEAGISLWKYLDHQLLPVLKNEKVFTTDNRFRILINLAIDLTIPLFMVISVLVAGLKKKEFMLLSSKRNFLFLLLVAASASIPLIISMKQRKYYLIPSIPFYALSFSFLISEFVNQLVDKLKERILKIIRIISYTLLFTTLVLAVVRYNHFSRDRKQLEDIYKIAEILPAGTILGSDSILCDDWGLAAYLNRVGYISLDCSNNHHYFIQESSRLTSFPAGFRPLGPDLQKYTLMSRMVPHEKDPDKKNDFE